MKIIIAGSRTVPYTTDIDSIVEDSCFEITELVCGEARGADLHGKNWATMYKPNSIPVKSFPADWDKYGKSAGYIRNKQMGDYADGAIVIFDKEITRGSKNMLDYMRKSCKPVFSCFAEDYQQ
jgi:hypothetical protein